MRKLHAGQEVTERIGHQTTTGSKLGKEYVKAVYCHLDYLTCRQNASCKLPRLDETQAGIKTVVRKINNLRYAHDTTLMAESKQD